MSGALLLFIVFLGGVLIHALLSGFEAGFVSTNTIRVRHLAEQAESGHAKWVLRQLEKPERMIVLLVLGPVLSLVAATLAIVHLFPARPLLGAALATGTLLFLGELLPKSIFRAHPTRLMLAFTPVVRVLDAFFRPLTAPIQALSRPALKVIEAEQRDIRALIESQEDMRVLVDETAQSGQLDPHEQDMIHSIIDLQSVQANEIMVPRMNIKALPETATRDELVRLLRETGHTRIPIYRESLDEIIGVVSAFSILSGDGAQKGNGIQPLVREVLHVPDTMKLDDVLRVMRDQRQRLAIVIDEYGGTDGLITLEDILEEIFGEIHDEHDKAEQNIRRVAPNAYVIDARTTLEEVSAALSVTIEEEQVETLGGWLTHTSGRIPQRGEVLRIDRLEVTVLSGAPTHVSSLRVEVLPPEPGQTHGGT